MNGTMSFSRSHALCLCLRLCVCLAHSQHGMFKNTHMLVRERDAILKVSQRISCDAAGLLFQVSTQKDTAVWGRCTCLCLGD